MLKRNQRYINFLNALLEFCIFIFSYLVATYIRFNFLYNPFIGHGLNVVWNIEHIQGAVLFSITMCILYYFAHMYARERTFSFNKEIANVLIINALGIIGLSTFLYFTRITEFSRLTLSIFYIISTVFIILKRYITKKILRKIRKKGFNLKHVVVVGNGKLAINYIKSIKENLHYGFNINGYIANSKNDNIENYICNYENFEKWLEKKNIDSVVIALEPIDSLYMETIIKACEKCGVKASIIPYYQKYFPAQPTIDVIGNTKLINIRATPLDDLVKSSFKRIFDIIGSSILIILSSPIIAFAMIGIKISSPGPIFFKQLRVGKNKREFNMYKLRSMKVNDKENTAWTEGQDPRRTKFGSFLRKTSIDELPQFWNVLKGDMSLIGPRPEIPFHVERLKKEVPMYMLKHLVRPGITGLAQVNGYRGDTSIVKRIEFDIWYIENWSFILDMKILYKTVFGGMINDEKIDI